MHGEIIAALFAVVVDYKDNILIFLMALLKKCLSSYCGFKFRSRFLSNLISRSPFYIIDVGDLYLHSSSPTY
jgi:hypothetical protein